MTYYAFHSNALRLPRKWLTMEHKKALIGNDGELVVPEKFTDPKVLPYLPNLFLLDPDHEWLINRKLETPTKRWGFKSVLLVVGILAILVFAILFAFVMSSNQIKDVPEAIGRTALLSVCTVGIFPVMIGFKFHTTSSQRKTLTRDTLLRTQGRIIVGQLTRYKRRNGGHDLIDFQFTTPDDREINVHSQVSRRKNTSGFTIGNQENTEPQPGMPVAILYLNDEHYKLL